MQSPAAATSPPAILSEQRESKDPSCFLLALACPQHASLVTWPEQLSRRIGWRNALPLCLFFCSAREEFNLPVMYSARIRATIIMAVFSPEPHQGSLRRAEVGQPHVADWMLFDN